MDTDDTIPAALAECLQRLERGDLSARDRIIELVSDRLHSLVHRMLGRYPGVRRWEDTDDVFQNAAMRLHRALGAMQFESPRSIMALAATQLHIDHSPASDTNLDRWTLFHEAIGNLPDEEREVFHLVWYLGADQKTIATLLDCSERTVKYRWRAAREAVRAALDGKPPPS